MAKSRLFPIADWFNVLHDIFVIEKITFSLRLKSEIFDKCWRGWVEFINPYRTDFR